jgi:hypothetical protein
MASSDGLIFGARLTTGRSLNQPARLDCDGFAELVHLIGDVQLDIRYHRDNIFLPGGMAFIETHEPNRSL